MPDITDNSVHCDLLNAREGGATTAQTTTAHTNPKTRVTKSPKLLKNQANDLQLHEDLVTNVPTDDLCDSTHIIQCNAHSCRDLKENMITPHVTVESDTPDAVSSVQTHLPIVDHCVKEEVVPLYIWDNKHNCKDYVACIRQNGDTFGYIPLSNLKLYQGPQITWVTTPSILQAHKLIRQSGVPNFLNCSFPVQTQLHPDRWRHYLTDYWDQQLTDLIQYLFPLDFDRKFPLSSSKTNHTSAIEHGTHVEAYIKKELEYGALYGPFQDLDFQIHVSPLMTREKHNSDSRRTIMDLSWPKGFSVNDAIHKCKYLDSYFTLQYPSIDHIINKVKAIGPGSLLYKVDISRAFRHIRIDLGDIDLLGLHYKHTYLDGSMLFGYRLGSGIFERCSDAIRYMAIQIL